MENSTDADLINQAYQDAVKGIFIVFSEAYRGSKGDPDVKIAIERFQAGISQARKTRDLAVTSLP